MVGVLRKVLRQLIAGAAVLVGQLQGGVADLLVGGDQGDGLAVLAGGGVAEAQVQPAVFVVRPGVDHGDLAAQGVRVVLVAVELTGGHIGHGVAGVRGIAGPGKVKLRLDIFGAGQIARGRLSFGGGLFSVVGAAADNGVIAEGLDPAFIRGLFPLNGQSIG